MVWVHINFMGDEAQSSETMLLFPNLSSFSAIQFVIDSGYPKMPLENQWFFSSSFSNFQIFFNIPSGSSN